MNQAQEQSQSQESFSVFQPICPAPVQPVEAVQVVQYIPPALPASFPSVTEPYLRKRTVHEVAHGVPFSEQKRFKPTQ